ncbi:MAG: hypothetical protein CM15mP49_25950 [Actinomycetota bacterium]|nr:MAG: hypothetical protein CM15mP49_25950 [Actinomycetota bacterium]
MDRLDPDVMKSAYWPEATDDHGNFVGNAHEFVEYCMKAHLRWKWTMHSIYNHQIELDDDGINARGEIYNISHLCREGQILLIRGLVGISINMRSVVRTGKLLKESVCTTEHK